MSFPYISRLTPFYVAVIPFTRQVRDRISFSDWSGEISSNSIILVLGGARSGKSACAERIVAGFDLPKVYIATAQAFDDEMSARIEQHKSDRGMGWDTKEAPLELVEVLSDVPSGNVVLVDCMTLWLSNVILAERDVAFELDRLFGSLKGPLVLVSNELGMGIVPDSKLGRAFRDAHGRMNQQVAKLADQVVFVAAGLPLMLKGEMPKGAL